MLEPCGGCKFHSFPYTAELPIAIDGKYPKKTFRTADDIWEVIYLLEEEVLSANKKTGKSFDVNEAIASQYSFFACYNNIASRDVKNDLNRYLYSKEFGTSAYKGSYGEQPCLWVEKVFLYKNIFAKLEKSQIQKIKNNGNKHTNNRN